MDGRSDMWHIFSILNSFISKISFISLCLVHCLGMLNISISINLDFSIFYYEFICLKLIIINDIVS